jgi:hypothetical protein
MMSEHEFENYLRLLGGLLKLSSKQRALIAGELRDHMEERLRDLLQQGLQRERAIAIALEEFGEGAALAADLTRIGKQRTRRWIMRVTIGSITAAAAAVLVAMTLWPNSPGGIAPQAAVAQQNDQLPQAEPARASVGKLAAAKKPASATEDERNAATRAKLTQPIDADFADTLGDAMQEIADRIGVQVFIDGVSLDDEGIGTDTPVTIRLQDVPVDTLLDLMLGQLGIGYRVRSGILVVSTQIELQDAIDIRVYDVRDLLPANRSVAQTKGDVDRDAYGGGVGGYGGRGGRGGGRGGYDEGGYGEGYGGGMRSNQPPRPGTAGPVDIDALLELNRLAEQLSSSLSRGDKDRAVTYSMARRVAELSDRLLDVSGGKLLKIITATVEPDSWDCHGGPGSILEYQGALIVSQTQDAHRQLQQLLDDLRKVAKANRGPATARPQLRRAANARRRGAIDFGGRGASGDPFGGAPGGIGGPLRVPRGAADEDDLFNDVDTPVDDLFEAPPDDKAKKPQDDGG